MLRVKEKLVFYPQNVPFFPYYAHADNNSRLAIAVTTLSSPSLIDKPATGPTVNAFLSD